MRDALWRFARWLLVATLVVVAAYFIHQQISDRYDLKVASVNPALPRIFRANEWVFWSWVFGAGIVGGVGIWWVVSRARAWSRAVPLDTEEDPLLERAWAEVLAIVAPRQSTIVYIIFAPTDDMVASLLRASVLNPSAVAPDRDADPSAPLRAFQTEEGLVLWCGGRPLQTVAYVSKAMERISPSRSMLRGVVTVFPHDALEGSKGMELASTYRAAIRGVATGSDVRCPLVAIISGMESAPGFLEFVKRMPSNFRDRGRFGFSLSGGGDRAVKMISTEYNVLMSWRERKALELMAERPEDPEGNFRLHALGTWLGRVRKRLLGVLEALANPDEDDPIALAGCYFVADGEDPDSWACAAPTMQGRVVGDPDSARWSRSTHEADQARRRQVATLSASGFVVLACFWLLTLWGVGTPGPVTWLTLSATAAGWAWFLWQWLRRSSDAR